MEARMLMEFAQEVLSLECNFILRYNILVKRQSKRQPSSFRDLLVGPLSCTVFLRLKFFCTNIKFHQGCDPVLGGILSSMNLWVLISLVCLFLFRY